MMENFLYDRQKSMNIFTDLSLTIVGCGGIGYWTALFCAMSGVNDIYLYDPDDIEHSNLNRLSISEDAIGKNKVDVIKNIINDIRPLCNVKAFNLRFSSMFAYKCKCIVDCTDNIKSQMENQKITKDMGAKYIKLGYNGEHITIADKVAMWGDGGEEEGYTITPSWVVPSVIVAAMGVGKVLKYFDKEISCDIKDLYEIGIIRKDVKHLKVKNVAQDLDCSPIVSDILDRTHSGTQLSEIAKRIGITNEIK